MNCEIEFLPVGDGSKAGDAIIVRYGEAYAWELLVIDGGSRESGDRLVNHVRSVFGSTAVVAHAVVTHPDIDHASGMRDVLEGLPVRNLWLHQPWAFAAAARPYFADKRLTDQGLAQALRGEYDVLVDLVATAEAKNIVVQQPFAGATIGPFRVVSPYQGMYPYFMPQFDRTPEPDQKALEAAGVWIGKPPSPLSRLLEKAVAKVQNWVPETWAHERLKDGGKTSATNETSVVLYGDFGPSSRVLLTGDSGWWGLTMAMTFAQDNALALGDFALVQIPHHGSRRNVGPTTLNALIGPIKPEGVPAHAAAFVSAPKDDTTHPRKMVVNAFIRRGYRVAATQGKSIVHYGGFPPRQGYGPLQTLSFATQVEDYD